MNANEYLQAISISGLKEAAEEKSFFTKGEPKVIEVSDEEIVTRLSGRRECGKCGTPYHTVYKPSSKGNICDVCGGELIQRADDNEETVKNRIKVYHEQTEPIKEYYQNTGKLVVVYGKEKLEDTTKAVSEALGLE